MGAGLGYNCSIFQEWPPGCLKLEQGSADHALAWLQALYQHEHVDFERASALLRAAIRVPEPDYFTQLLDIQIFELARRELISHSITSGDKACLEDR